jgi:hypothetical protein
MDNESSLKRLKEFMGLEQEFLHLQFMKKAAKLDKKELLEILDLTHANYLVRGRLFSKLTQWCLVNQMPLPAIDDLLKR